MNGILVDQSLLMHKDAQFSEINLAEAQIGRQLDLSDSTVTGSLDMNGIRVGRDLFMRGNAQFEAINLVVAHIGGTLDLNGSRVRKILDMNAIRIDQNLFMRDNAQFTEIDLTGAQIGGQLDLSGSRVMDVLYMNQVVVGQALLMRDTNISQLTLRGVQLHSDLSIGGQSRFDNVEILNSTLEGALLLGRGDLVVGDSLIRGNNEIQYIFIEDTNIKGMLDLSSIISRIAILNSKANRVFLPSDVPTRVSIQTFEFSSWLNNLPATVAYLDKNASYDSGLFERIAQSYRLRGEYSAARRVQYLRANGEYKNSSGLERYLLYINWATVGYGYYPEVGFIWIGALVLCGFFVFRTGRLTRGVRPRSWLIYSIDTVVPVIKLDTKHDEVQFAGWQQFFVYVMRMLSAGLAFLVFKVLQNAIAGG
jgi:uncharacterized protein YjbI with pentapeptide repeats